MGRIRVTPGERVRPDEYFAAYVRDTLRNTRASNAIQHLRDYGHSMLGSRYAADAIIDEVLNDMEE